ncbi:AhpC/TSA family protein [Streptomyces sp. KS_16]|nr:redoxin domain-containing protein [Streptomyces sp. KS_16]PBC86933.1 AhpC/TSA family protein [Streptomyces sp. 2321.6]SDQ67423.1 AhpC/TSA family protein [Streptomyces sp. KS_16]SEE14023.1 AhpC/TSA family protein [Streptomyces sp. 2133.1]SNC74110.1 AhpC/TSA family protein [Streptomyces sp. 2114.4]
MPFLIPALVLVGALCVLDLILTLGVVKRLRDHTALLANTSAVDTYTINVGEHVGEFTSSSVDGEEVTHQLPEEDTLVAFFSPTCGPCKDKLPKFVEHVERRGIARERVLVAIVGDAEESRGFIEQLSPVARVVSERSDGLLTAAFKVKAFPTVLTVSPDGVGGTVVTDNDVRLDAPAALAA